MTKFGHSFIAKDIEISLLVRFALYLIFRRKLLTL